MAEPKITIRGRHITQQPGPLESQGIAAKFYAEVDTTEFSGVDMVKVRIDDELHPDFWLEVFFPASMVAEVLKQS